MQSRDFCYWLQGFFEIHAASTTNNQSSPPLTTQQVEAIRNHLNMVFKHEIDPSMGGKKHQQELNTLHGPTFDASSMIARC